MLPAATGNADTIDRIAATYGVCFEALELSAATGSSVNNTATLMNVERDRYREMTLPSRVQPGTSGVAAPPSSIDHPEERHRYPCD